MRGDAGQPFAALGLTLLCLWPIGIEHFVPLIVLPVYVFVFKKTRGTPACQIHVAGSAPVYLLALFLGFVVISSAQVTQSVRLMTYTRDLMAWICATALFAHFYAHYQTYRLVDGVRPLAIAFWVIVASCAFYIVIGSIQFPSLGYLAAPDFIKTSMTGARFLLKDFGEQLYFYGFTDRVSSFFGSPIHLACVLFLLLPFALHDRQSTVGRVIVYGAALTVVFFAQARVALVLMALYPLLVGMRRAAVAPTFSPASLLAVTVIVVVCAVAILLFSQSGVAFAKEAFLERRSGSVEARTMIYTQSLEWIKQRPFWGYGTQIDVAGLEYPLGSHSTPIGLAFKYGLIACLGMMGFLMSSYVVVIQVFRRERAREASLFYGCLLSSFTCYYALITVNEFVVDLYHHLVLFAVLGALWGTRRQTCVAHDRPRATAACAIGE
ncbi:O-antigen ligase family protein [Celeribacter marinus]|uniref:O-antigen ligase-related domain-containing protein n=1 Tax=Celeribacter marinus TaxID=1397108 RepID=A0A0P0ADA4_9RHOB|nr:O-antigen ligase family protein [Celeribacter marinus]ALI56185.1 hypothetical protein IMCC12053_2238 [Celeribacter marinus]SFK85647.1 O-Antigen ligase [Celeribacter marinus]